MSTVKELLEGWTRGLRDGVIAIPRCERCKAWNWYPRSLCPACGCGERAMVRVRAQGAIKSWTRVHRALPPVQHLPVPYLVALVELDDAQGARVFCRAEEPAREPSLGEAVSIFIEQEEGDLPFLKYRYC